jgi:endonuclease YncB( thermonuclease family)
MSTSLRSICRGLLFLFVVPCAVRAQDAKSKPTVNLDFSNDPCGNPLMESQLWVVVEGKVSQVLDSQTLTMTLPHRHHSLRVHIVGIFIESNDPLARKTQELLSQILLARPVELLVNDDWEYEKKKPAEVTGVVLLKQRTSNVDDVGLFLLSQGLAHFQEPQPYKMSRYTECQYQRAEAEARSKKLGMWASR